MLRYVLLMLMWVVSSPVYAHEMVPTYPKLEPSYMEGLYKTSLTVFNKRPEIEYYEIGVFTEEWEPIRFVSSYKVYKVPYLSTITFDIYIQDINKDKVTYICSVSKLRKSVANRTAISSRICSRVKRLGE
jgi:hypothetical protein